MRWHNRSLNFDRSSKSSLKNNSSLVLYSTLQKSKKKTLHFQVLRCSISDLQAASASSNLVIITIQLISFWTFRVNPRAFSFQVLTLDFLIIFRWKLVCETITYVLINAATIYLFVTKPYIWPHEPDQVQRFIWWTLFEL